MSFISSIFLWFLPLITIPLIFHLLKRRKYQNISFSTLRFFKSIQTEAINKLSIINIILLIIRTLIILFIILLLSRPTIEGKFNSKYSNNNNLTYVIIDDSYSNIQFIQNDLTKLLKQIYNSYNENTTFMISLLSDNSIIHNGKLQLNKITSLNIDPSFTSKKFNINNILDNILDKDIYSNIDIYFVSDFQSKSFPPINEESISIKDNINFFILKNEPNNKNIFINNVSIENNVIIPNEIIDINTQISSTSLNVDNLEVELHINNINVGKNTLNIKENNFYNLKFRTSIPEEGRYNCKLSINDPSELNLDDNYYFTLETNKESNICIISNSNEDYYFTKAVNTYNQLHKNLSIIHLTSENYLLNNHSTFESVIVFDYSLITKELYYKINSQTNNIIVIPNEDFKANNYLSKLLNMEAYSNLKSTHLKNDSFISIDTESIKDPNLSLIFSSDIPERKLIFFKYTNIPISANTIIAHDNGYSFLNKFEIENNTLITLSTPLDLSSSNLPIKGIFIPFVLEITKENVLKNHYTCNETINSEEDIAYTITPTKDTILINNKSLKLNNIGFHKLFYNSNDNDFIALNIDQNEFNDTYLTNDQVLTIFPDVTIIDVNSSFQEKLNNMVVGYEIWRYLLYFIIILIIAEMYLSNIYFIKND